MKRDDENMIENYNRWWKVKGNDENWEKMMEKVPNVRSNPQIWDFMHFLYIFCSNS